MCGWHVLSRTRAASDDTNSRWPTGTQPREHRAITGLASPATLPGRLSVRAEQVRDGLHLPGDQPARQTPTRNDIKPARSHQYQDALSNGLQC